MCLVRVSCLIVQVSCFTISRIVIQVARVWSQLVEVIAGDPSTRPIEEAARTTRAEEQVSA